MASKEDLIKQAEEKWNREQLIAAAEAKWAGSQPAAPVEAPDRNLGEKLETGARSALEGLTLGVSEPVLSGANAGVGQVMDAAMDSDGLGDFVKRLVDTGHLKDLYDQDVARRNQLKKDLPVISTASEIGGALVPAFIPGGQSAALNIGGKAGSLLAKGARAATELVPGVKAGAEAANLGGRALRIGQGALEGGAVALGTEGLKRGVELGSGFMDPNDERSSLGETALLGAKFGGALSAAPELYGVVKSGAKNLLSAFGGVKPETIGEYLKSAPAIRSADTLPDLKEKVDAAIHQVQEGLQNSKLDYADEVIGAVDQLKDKVIQGSKDAYSILDKSTDSISLSDIQKEIEAAKKSLFVAGKAPVGGAAKAAVSSLDEYANTFKQLPEELSLPDTKKIIQQMDDDINYISSAGEFGSRGSNALKSVRRYIDGVIKTKSPEYAEKMKDVAQDTELLSTVSKKFGNADTVYNKIDKLSSPGKALESDVLDRLASRTGKDLMGPLGQLDQAAPIARMNPASSESFIKSVMNGNSIENKNKLAQLSQLSDVDLLTMAQNTGVSEAFNKEFRAGSQHTNLWAMVGGAALGGLTGDQVGGGVGLGTGAVMGALVTKFGPAMTRKILDGYLKIEGLPTVQKIDQAFKAVPDSVKQQLKSDLVRAVSIANEGAAPIYVPNENRLQTRSDIKGASGLSVIEKARALDALNRQGYVSPDVLRKAMVGNQPKAPSMPVPLPVTKPTPAPSVNQMTDYFKSMKQEDF